MPHSVPQPLVDIHRAKTVLFTTENHVRRLVSNGELPSVRVGRFLRFRPEDLADYIDANTTSQRASA